MNVRRSQQLNALATKKDKLAFNTYCGAHGAFGTRNGHCAEYAPGTAHLPAWKSVTIKLTYDPPPGSSRVNASSQAHSTPRRSVPPSGGLFVVISS
jgi:hypothetical protein